MGVSKVDGIVPMEEGLAASDISRYRVVRKNWFAYNPMRLNIGSIARWHGNSDILVSPDYVVFRCLEESDQNSLSADYLDHFRRSDQWDAFVTEAGDGGVRVRIYYDDISQLRLSLPDIAEQQKIADCLGSLDGLIAAEGRKLEALRQHKQGLMQQLFPQPGETVPLLGNQSDWEMLDLSEVAFFQEGPGIMAKDFYTEGVPLVRLSCVVGTTVTLDGCDYLNPDKVVQKWEHFRLVVGDLLISTSASFGRVSIVTEVAAGAVFYTGLVRFRSKSKRLSNDYLKAYLESPDFLRQAESHAVGGGIKHFGPTHLRQMQIQVPPLPEQRRIADCLSCLDACIDGQSRRLDSLKQHKKGLQQQLFPSLQGNE
ncbi:restriction endonuclease subunit S [Bradyrhizobium genosp. SA-3]|nr:restriction endonuclease subunit S [Bradyrhizobium genosp. SA-3]